MVPTGLLAILAMSGIVSGSATDSPSTFADRLFEAAMPYVNRSLNGLFISQMANGSLPDPAFQRYLAQDNLYLGKYARAYGVMAAKVAKTDELVWLLKSASEYLAEHGSVNDTTMDSSVFDQKAMPVTVAYTSFFLQAAWGERPFLAYVSLLPCQRLYDWLFSTLKATRHITNDNPYKSFIYQYAEPSNHLMTVEMEGFVERYFKAGISDETEARAHELYNRAMQYEATFWAQALADDGLSQVSSRRFSGRKVLREAQSVV